ncbi:MAG TPA: AAA family ATPase [Xanthobacteraceae bacterium]|nr:AAA family ATPase [Xanthobacteraceae bacterium]
MTILLADISDYTAMNEKMDPELVNELLDRIKKLSADVVKRHGGFINQFIGDEVVAVFGIGSTENTSQAAVQAAWDIRAGIRQLDPQHSELVAENLSMHFGICSGLLVIRPAGNREGIFSLTGDPINTAARLLQAAETGEIIVGSESEHSVRPFFIIEPTEPLSLKGKSGLVRAFRVCGVRPVSSSFQARAAQGLASFTGRQLELAQLRQVAELARDGEGQVLAIFGQPGVGKSRLIHEFLEQPDCTSFAVHAGRCASSTMATPYHPWLELMRAMFRLDDVNGANKLIDAIREHDVAARHIPLLLSMFSLTHPDFPMPSEVARQERPQMIRDAIVSVIRAFAAHRPQIIWLEDWHWADAASNQCMRELLRVVAGIPVLVIVTARPGTSLEWPIKDNITTLTLRPLDRKATGAMVSALCSGAIVPESLINVFYERTEGNALFVEELISFMQHDQLIVIRDGVLTLTRPLATLIIPDTVQSAVLRRLDSLDHERREVLRRASVFGHEFTLSLLKRIVPDRIDLDGAIAALVGQDFIIEIPADTEVRYSFKHVITQEVAYETLLHKQRRELHAAVGRTIEEVHATRLEEFYDQLAFHYARSEDTERALKYLEKAGDRAAATFALDAARSQYMGALKILDTVEDDSAIRRRIEISIKSAAASQFAAAERHIEVMNQACADALKINDDNLAAKCRYWLGRMYYGLGKPAAAIEHFKSSLVLASNLGDVELIGRCKCVIGRASLFTADLVRGLEYLSQGIESMRTLGNESEATYSMSSMGCVLALTGKFNAAEQRFADALSIARQKNNRADEALVTQQLSYARCLRGDWDGAIEAAERCIDLSAKCGLPLLLEFGHIFRAYAHAMGYELNGGYRRMREAIAAYESTEAQLAASICHGWFAEICSLYGDLDAARRHADISIAREAVGDRFGQIPALRALAQIATHEGRSEAARELLNQAATIAEAWGAQPDRGITYLRTAEIDRNSPSAAALKSRAAQVFEGCEMPWWRAYA